LRVDAELKDGYSDAAEAVIIAPQAAVVPNTGPWHGPGWPPLRGRNDHGPLQPKSNAMASIAGAARTVVDEVRPSSSRRGRVGVGGSGCFWSSATTSFECLSGGCKGAALLTKGRLDELDTSRLPRQLQSQPFEVRLDGSRVLSKILKLPAASSGYLDPIVRHQLDRVTPWAADRVVYGLCHRGGRAGERWSDRGAPRRHRGATCSTA